MQLFINDLRNSSKGIDFDICRLKLCNQNCPESNLLHDEDIDKNRDKKSTNLFVTILLAVVILFAVVAVLLCLVLFCLRYSIMLYICILSKYAYA